MVTFKSFTECNNDELVMILSWRNHANVRNNSYNDKVISYQNHIDFISTLGGGNCRKHFFLVTEGGEHLGVVSLTCDDLFTAEIGYYKNPELTKRGVGVTLLEAASQKAKELDLKEIITTVFATNTASIKCIERSGFKKVEEETRYFERNCSNIDINLYRKKITT